MANILDEVMKLLPEKEKSSITDSYFEGANIVLYTKDKKFFLDNNGIIREIVNTIKKRVELRCDPSLVIDEEKSRKAIEKILPAESGVSNIIFDPQRSVVVIEVKKPGLAIGKSGSLLKEIRKETLWVPLIKRTPALRSTIIENIRNVLYENNDYRKKFLNRIGKRIYEGYTKERKHEWVRVSFLGGAREVGRSCLLLQTTESRILMDCGVNVAAPESEAYPYLEAPEFNLSEIDAIIATHAHIDHIAMIPLLYKYGYVGPTYATEPVRDIMALLCLDFIEIAQKEGKKVPYSSTDIKNMVKHTICLDYEEVSDITPDVRLTLYNSGHALGASMCHLHIGEGLHNLLYSLDYETPVTIFDENGVIDYRAIGEIIEKEFKTNNRVVIHHKGAEEIPNFNGLKTIVFNPTTYKTEIKEITSFIRHPIKEDLYEIETASGRRTKVTASHSLFSIINAKLVAVKVSELKKGDFILGPKKLPVINKKPILDLLKYAPKIRVYINDSYLVENIIKTNEQKLSGLIEERKVEALNWLKDFYSEGMYKNYIAKKYHVHIRRVRKLFNELGINDHPRVNHRLPHTFEIKEDFARFLGYYVSEGCISKNTIQITNNSYEILEDCYNIIKRTFGIEGDIRENVVLFCSKQLKYLIKDILNCGNNAYEKRAPKEILSAPKEIMANFLNGYFSGDGGISVRTYGRSITANSKNPKLIEDIVFMLLQFGIVPTIRYNKTTDMYIAFIYNSEKITQFLREIGMKNNQVPLLERSLNLKKLKSSFDLRIPLLALSKKGQACLSRTNYKNAKSCGIRILNNKDDIIDIDKKVINSDLFFDQVVLTKKIKPSKKYVYDFKIIGFENFLGGNGFLFMHNTSDMNFENTNLLAPAETRFPRLETCIIEGTYGGSDDKTTTRRDSEEQLIKVVKETMERDGKVIMPILGVGRSQEIMLILERLVREKKLEKLPIYIQGMCWDVTAIHTAYPDFFNMRVKKQIFHQDTNPFLSEIFKRVGSQKEMEQVIMDSGPCIIMATSGMMTGGSSVEYFKKLADNKNNSIVFTCYQAEGSLGRRIEQGEKKINLGSQDKLEIIDVKLSVHSIKGFSGHSNREQLLSFVHRLDPKPRKIIVVHGESSKCLDLASSLHKLNRIETNAPKNLEVIRLR